jgi:tetratricopeptide (TPR) repeat protein
MILDWFNASGAAEVGKTLADYYLRHGGSQPPVPGTRPSEANPAGLNKLLRHATRETGSIKLNAFQRAKLLNSFNWRLREQGVDRNDANELTQMVLFQICGSSAKPGVPPAAAEPNPPSSGPDRRITSLLAEADAHFAAGRRSETAVSLRRILRLDPNHPVAHAKLGAALCYLGRYDEAEWMLRRAVELDGRSAEAHRNLGGVLYYRGEFAAAETTLRRAAKLDPRNAETLVSLGLTLGARSRLDAAKDCFAKALVLKPRNAGALWGLGWLAGIEGRFEDCERFYRDALAADPHKPRAWASLAQIRRMTSADGEWLENVKRLITADIQPLDEAALRFAMGKYFDDLGNFAEAFGQYKRANDLQKLVARPYARKERSSFVDDTIRVYTAEAIGRRVEGASQSIKPVFVVGMMRSGTSLVEQIIASHPRASGAGELDFWKDAAQRVRDRLQGGVPDALLAKKLADSYLTALSGHVRDELRVVDKSTFNSDHLGLIHSVFPSSRIIYVRRDPVDTCLSCYFQQFANAASFTFDLADLAHYYREHHRLMQHWRAVLPAGALLEVPYAELVADQESWSRRMIEFIGLEWDPHCLEYYTTQRPVLTASNWQVRQRIYSSSIGRWRNYRKFIRPLLELRELEPASESRLPA